MRNEQVCGVDLVGMFCSLEMEQDASERRDQRGLGRDVGEIGFQAMVR